MTTFPGLYRAKSVKIDGTKLTAQIPQVYGEATVIVSDFIGAMPSAVGMGWVSFHAGDAAFPVWHGGGEPASSQTLLSAYWQYHNTASAPPGPGEIRTASPVTTMWLSDVDNGGFNRDSRLSQVVSGDTIQLKGSDGSIFILRVNGTPVDNTTYWTYPVEVVSGAEGGKKGTVIEVSLIVSTGSGGGGVGPKGDKGDPGDPGTPGTPGAAGAGVPVGGLAGQALTKINSTNYNTQWTTLGVATHAATHASGGTDPVTLAQSQVTSLTSDLSARALAATTVTATAPLTGSGTLGANLTLGIASATTAVVGATRLATPAEATAQTLTTVAVTPAGLVDRVLTSALTLSENKERSKGGQLIVNGTGYLGDITNFNNGATTFVPSDHPFGTSGSFLAGPTGNQAFVTDEYIPIDVNKWYVISAWARETVPGTVAPFAYLGLQPYDNANGAIGPQHVSWQTNTTTTLAADLIPGATTITLTSAANWNNAAGGANTHLRGMLVWNYVDASGYAWPPETYSRNFYFGLYADGGISGNVITLSVPWSGPTLTAGTAVSNSTSGGTYMYTAWSASPTPETWTFRDNVIAPVGGGPKTTNAIPTTKFPYGTAKIKIAFLGNRVAGSRTAWAGMSMTETVAYPNIATTAPLTGGGSLAGIVTLAISGATTAAVGAMRFATTAESTAQTLTNVAVAPAGLANRLLKTGDTMNGALACASTVGFNGATPVGKAANPGTAAGTDAAVINAVVTALRNVGLVT